MVRGGKNVWPRALRGSDKYIKLFKSRKLSPCNKVQKKNCAK